jgi:hypothetical protein
VKIIGALHTGAIANRLSTTFRYGSAVRDIEISWHQQINSHKIITLEALAETSSRSLDINSPLLESLSF